MVYEPTYYSDEDFKEASKFNTMDSTEVRGGRGSDGNPCLFVYFHKEYIGSNIGKSVFEGEKLVKNDYLVELI